VLCVLATEKCIKTPNTIIKYCAPTKSQVSEILDIVMKPILEDCPAHLKPEWKETKKRFEFPNGSMIQIAATEKGHIETLRGGQCLGPHTEIMTPTGPKRILDINIGDTIYGVNEKWEVEETKVVNKICNGVKKVTEILNGKTQQIIATCTDDHVWATTSKTSMSRRQEIPKQKLFKDINENNDRVLRRKVNIPCGTISEPHAYVIGAFLGDGCTAIGYGNTLHLSTIDMPIATKIKNILGDHVLIKNLIERDNRVIFSTTLEKYKHSKKLTFNYYEQWMKGQSEYVKNFDYNIVDTWDRQSCLALLAGLIDTDGNVFRDKKGITLTFNQSNEGLIKNIQKLVWKLFQYRATIREDKRYHKYKYPHYKLIIRSSLVVKQMLTEMQSYIALYRKQWKEEYNTIHSSEFTNYYKITKGDSYYSEVYDIEVDIPTHLYLTADGLITHNCSIGIVDEAGFATGLDYVVQNILIPAVATTKGRIILCSTPNYEDPQHPFNVDYLAPREAAGTLEKFTIYDAPMLDEEAIKETIEAYGGEDNPRFKCEFKCEITVDPEKMVFPEINTESQEFIVKEVERPKFYDTYVSMDIGGRDLTGVVFAYYDYLNETIVILDEYIVNGAELTTDNLAENIKRLEKLHFTDPESGFFIKPLRYADNNNPILLNDLFRLHNLNFIATAKDNKFAQVNEVKLRLRKEKIIIHPRCVNLLYQMKSLKWDKHRKGFERIRANKSKGYPASHGDLGDATIYLVRNVNTTKNPYPVGYFELKGPNVFGATTYKVEESVRNFMSSLMGFKKKE
jgi:hypothetical protein